VPYKLDYSLINESRDCTTKNITIHTQKNKPREIQYQFQFKHFKTYHHVFINRSSTSERSIVLLECINKYKTEKTKGVVREMVNGRRKWRKKAYFGVMVVICAEE